MTARYALYPGPVRSRTDGDRHHVGAQALARLYRVRMADCLVVDPAYFTQPDRRAFIARAAVLIPLYPRADGCYVLPALQPLPSLTNHPAMTISTRNKPFPDRAGHPAPDCAWCAACTPETCSGCSPANCAGCRRPEPAPTPEAFVYHFYAMSRLSPDVVQHADGSITCTELLSTVALYNEAKLRIAEFCDLADAPEKLILCSLTLLNPPR